MAYESHLDDPEYWRNRVQEIRALLEQVSSLEARDQVLKMAEDYELLAERAAQRRKQP